VARILGISGSLRRDSHNTSLLRAAAETAGPDVELELYDDLKEVPSYDEHGELHPPGFGAAWAQAELRKVLAALRARVVGVELPVPRAHTRFEEGELSDEEIRAGLAKAVAALAEKIRQREHAKVVA
jgi:NAD(P)H-dependent FMN reductase